MRTLILVAALSASVTGQSGPPDPYTGGERSALDAAGYHNLGPFRIGGYHGTADVEELLGSEQVRWIETAHFKIGSTLAPYLLPRDEEQRNKIRDELERLHRRIPLVDPRATRLDPWLRTHLVAQRCEEVYADFQERLGVSDLDFPQRRQDVQLGENFMGLGPYLGQREKYVVLVFESARDVARYSKQYLGQELRWPQRFNLGMGRSLLFVTSPELGGWLVDDTAMHVHLVYDVVHMLCDGYRNFGHETPVWFKTGLAQWYARRIDPRYPNFDRPPSGVPKGSMIWRWEPIVERLCRDDRATPMEEMATWRDYGPFRFEDYAVAWSRVAYLMDRFGDSGLRRFLFRYKDPLTLGRTEPGWDLVLAKQQDALREGYGFADWGALDREWRAWVLRVADGARTSVRVRR